MKELFSEIRGAIFATLVLAIVCCGAYPLVVFGISQALFHDKANGSLIVDKDGVVRGSKLLAQGFTSAKYFHPRPSAAGNGYDAANSGGSNLGPTNQKLLDRVKVSVDAAQSENPNIPVPVDLVTTSGSGLDPDISPASAYFQVPRVSRARGVSEERLREMVAGHIQPRTIGILGEPRVNVLELNLA